MFNGKFGVDPPWYRESQVEREAFNLYAMECEGDIPTRRGKINKFIKLLKMYPGANDDWAIQQSCLDRAGIDFEFKDKNIIVSNSQWLLLHGDELPYIDCIIQDEVHRC